jgi:hypothetical protein
MRHALLFTPALFLLIAAAAAACGGSSSETPWPIEPEGAQLGPTGEEKVPSVITEDRADAGRHRTP